MDNEDFYPEDIERKIKELEYRVWKEWGNPNSFDSCKEMEIEEPSKQYNDEKDVVDDFVKYLKDHGYRVYTRVSECYDIPLPHTPYILARPDIDIIAIKGNQVLCFEAKRDTRITDLHKALGEALADLVNPIISPTRINPEEGVPERQKGICDEVYILLPSMPKDRRLCDILKLTPIGLWLVNGIKVVQAKQNPYLDPIKKEIFLNNIDECAKFIYKYRNKEKEKEEEKTYPYQNQTITPEFFRNEVMRLLTCYRVNTLSYYSILTGITINYDGNKLDVFGTSEGKRIEIDELAKSYPGALRIVLRILPYVLDDIRNGRSIQCQQYNSSRCSNVQGISQSSLLRLYLKVHNTPYGKGLPNQIIRTQPYYNIQKIVADIIQDHGIPRGDAIAFTGPAQHAYKLINKSRNKNPADLFEEIINNFLDSILGIPKDPCRVVKAMINIPTCQIEDAIRDILRCIMSI